MRLRKSIFLTASVVVGIFSIGYFARPLRHTIRIVATTAQARFTPAVAAPFPSINENGLTAQQLRIVNLARVEYQKRPVSYDESVLKYTEGTKEAWCADFLSWIMLQAGSPYSNPNFGGWRIPGVLTLRDYYESEGRYVLAGKYQPRVGDVAIYVGRHTFDLFSTEHAALVVQAGEGSMITVGGNEGGRLRTNVQTTTAGESSLVGFGKLK